MLDQLVCTASSSRRSYARIFHSSTPRFWVVLEDQAPPVEYKPHETKASSCQADHALAFTSRLCIISAAILTLTVRHASTSLHLLVLLARPPDFWRYIPGTVAGLAAGTWSKVPLRCAVFQMMPIDTRRRDHVSSSVIFIPRTTRLIFDPCQVSAILFHHVW